MDLVDRPAVDPQEVRLDAPRFEPARPVGPQRGFVADRRRKEHDLEPGQAAGAVQRRIEQPPGETPAPVAWTDVDGHDDRPVAALGGFRANQSEHADQGVAVERTERRPFAGRRPGVLQALAVHLRAAVPHLVDVA